MAEIKLRKKLIYSGEVFASFMAKGWNCTELANVLRVCKEVDAVEVVRCKDCKYFIEPTATDGLCELDGNHRIIWRNDDFCSYGERREGE